LAFFLARFYYYLHTQQNWSILTAAIVSIGLAGPLMGIFL
jgi:branched-chain amino acid transport system permease protein